MRDKEPEAPDTEGTKPVAIYENGRPRMIVARLDPPGFQPGGNCVELLIPELEMELVDMGSSEPIHQRVTEPSGKDMVWWLARACQSAVNGNAMLFLTCDTVEECETAARLALVMLAPEGYRNVPVAERPDGATVN